MQHPTEYLHKTEIASTSICQSLQHMFTNLYRIILYEFILHKTCTTLKTKTKNKFIASPTQHVAY